MSAGVCQEQGYGTEFVSDAPEHDCKVDSAVSDILHTLWGRRDDCSPPVLEAADNQWLPEIRCVALDAW